MKLNKSFFQAMGIVTMLAQLPSDKFLKSRQLSNRMQVSHSYLLKLAKGLNNMHLINSSSSKKGGYALASPPQEITLLDIFNATEPSETFHIYSDLNLTKTLFINEELVEPNYKRFVKSLAEAEESYRKELSKHTLDEYLPHDSKGDLLIVDWSNILKDE